MTQSFPIWIHEREALIEPEVSGAVEAVEAAMAAADMQEEEAVQGKTKMRLQRMCGVLLVIAGLLALIAEKDMTPLAFLSLFYIPMFGKRYRMDF